MERSTDDGNAMRGIVIGCLLALPFWLVIGIAVVLLIIR
jgi:hypothetical protein